VIEDYGLNIGLFEERLQKIEANITGGLVYEKLSPSDLWKRSETDVTSLQKMAEQLKESMLLLKPEKAPSIERCTGALLQPLSIFRETLFRESDDPLADSKFALEELRRAIKEGSNFLDSAKEIMKNPSENILTVLRLKEVYDTKEYLSAVPVPEAAQVQFVGLRRNIENLKISIFHAEAALRELKKNLDVTVQETMKFRSPTPEKSEEKPPKPETSSEVMTGSEPTLITKDG
jgi:hypothetical protein